MSFLFKLKNNRATGFSLLEMMVVTGIFVVVTGVVLANLPRFRNRASLDLTAQEIALPVREAQVYGTATRVAGDSYPSYGVHFELNGVAAKKFILCADRDGDKIYDPGAGSCNESDTECLEEYTLDGQFQILQLFISQGAGTQCYSPGSETAIDAVYTRPFPEPTISLLTNHRDNGSQFTYAGARIGVPGGTGTRDIIIWNNGQISASSESNVCQSP